MTDWAIKEARDLIRRNSVAAVFKDEPGGMKRGGWADQFAEDIANSLRAANIRTRIKQDRKGA